MKVTLLHPLPAINKGNCGAVCRDGPNWILGPPIWSRTKDKEERHRKPDRHKWERDTKEIKRGVKPRGETPETQGETDRTGRHRREASTRDGEIGERQGRGRNQREQAWETGQGADLQAPGRFFADSQACPFPHPPSQGLPQGSAAVGGVPAGSWVSVAGDSFPTPISLALVLIGTDTFFHKDAPLDYPRGPRPPWSGSTEKGGGIKAKGAG